MVGEIHPKINFPSCKTLLPWDLYHIEQQQFTEGHITFPITRTGYTTEPFVEIPEKRIRLDPKGKERGFEVYTKRMPLWDICFSNSLCFTDRSSVKSKRRTSYTIKPRKQSALWAVNRKQHRKNEAFSKKKKVASFKFQAYLAPAIYKKSLGVPIRKIDLPIWSILNDTRAHNFHLEALFDSLGSPVLTISRDKMSHDHVTRMCVTSGCDIWWKCRIEASWIVVWRTWWILLPNLSFSCWVFGKIVKHVGHHHLIKSF